MAKPNAFENIMIGAEDGTDPPRMPLTKVVKRRTLSTKWKIF